MTLDEQVRSLRTVPELKAFLTGLGQDPDAVGYRHDRGQRRGSGEVLLERLTDGTWQAAVHERGNVSRPRRFTTEQEAVRTLALERLESHRRTPVPTTTPAELAEIEGTRAARQAHFAERARRAREERGAVEGGRS